MKYMGEDIDGFRRLLAGYKSTICIALTDATLRKSTATADSLEVYTDLVNTAQADLEDRLETIDEKLELILRQNLGASDSDISEIELIKEERRSTEKCLQICAQLSDHISQIQGTSNRGRNRDTSLDIGALPTRITHEGLQECKKSLANTALKLEGHEKLLLRRIVDKSTTAILSEEERADLMRLRDEWEATRQSMNICSRALDHLKDDVSTIDNYATGDAVQIMVSTKEKTVHGTNRGLGWRTRQVGGHMADESLQHIAKTLTSITILKPGNEQAPSHTADSPNSDDADATASNSKFKGKRFKLPSEFNPRRPGSSA